MGDSFSKIIAILISAILMFVLPVKITKERQEEFNQTYALSETMYLVDNVRNTGKLTKEMYDIYTQKLMGVVSNVRIEMLSMDKEYNDVIKNENIYSSLKINGYIEFDRYAYFKIVIYENDKAIAYYGGSVK